MNSTNLQQERQNNNNSISLQPLDSEDSDSIAFAHNDLKNKRRTTGSAANSWYMSSPPPVQQQQQQTCQRKSFLSQNAHVTIYNTNAAVRHQWQRGDSTGNSLSSSFESVSSDTDSSCSARLAELVLDDSMSTCSSLSAPSMDGGDNNCGGNQNFTGIGGNTLNFWRSKDKNLKTGDVKERSIPKIQPPRTAPVKIVTRDYDPFASVMSNNNINNKNESPSRFSVFSSSSNNVHFSPSNANNTYGVPSQNANYNPSISNANANNNNSLGYAGNGSVMKNHLSNISFVFGGNNTQHNNQCQQLQQRPSLTDQTTVNSSRNDATTATGLMLNPSRHLHQIGLEDFGHSYSSTVATASIANVNNDRSSNFELNGCTVQQRQQENIDYGVTTVGHALQLHSPTVNNPNYDHYSRKNNIHNPYVDHTTVNATVKPLGMLKQVDDIHSIHSINSNDGNGDDDSCYSLQKQPIKDQQKYHCKCGKRTFSKVVFCFCGSIWKRSILMLFFILFAAFFVIFRFYPENLPFDINRNNGNGGRGDALASNSSITTSNAMVTSSFTPTTHYYNTIDGHSRQPTSVPWSKEGVHQPATITPPTQNPTLEISLLTQFPSNLPLPPTGKPTTSLPTLSQTKQPTPSPSTSDPSFNPTRSPSTRTPTQSPSIFSPSFNPTWSPSTNTPTQSPSTYSPTGLPTENPILQTAAPSTKPTASPLFFCPFYFWKQNSQCSDPSINDHLGEGGDCIRDVSKTWKGKPTSRTCEDMSASLCKNREISKKENCRNKCVKFHKTCCCPPSEDTDDMDDDRDLHEGSPHLYFRN